MPRSRYSRFRDGVQISGVSMAVPQTGKVFYVSNNSTLTEFGIAGSNGNNGRTPEQPLATIDYAIGLCSANRGDTIFVMPGHAETISAAGGITLDVAGVSVIGMGEGATRPLITFSATTSTWTISAASCVVRNIVVTPSVDSVVTAFVVSASDVELEIESQDTSSAIEFVGVITTTAAADRFKLKLKHRGFTAGDAGVRAIVLVGCNGGDIDIDFYGIASTAIVGFVTTASTDVNIKGIFNNGVTALTKNVVDTVTGSTWEVAGYDVVGGYEFRGGSGTAVYPVMIQAVDNAANVLGADNSNNAFASTNVVANVDGSVLERLEALMDPLGGYIAGLGYRVTKVSNLADGSGTDALFTVTGTVAITLLTGEVTTVIGGAATMKLTDTTNSVDLCAATTIDTDAVGTRYLLTGVSAQILNGTGNTPVIGSVSGLTGQAPNRIIVGKTGTPITISHILDAADTGAVTWTLYYMPIVSGSTVAAAA